MPKAKITWLAGFIGNRANASARTVPDIAHIRNANVLTRWARRHSPAVNRDADIAAIGFIPGIAGRGE